MLRATGRVFAGWGPRQDDHEETSARGDEKPEPQERETHTPPSLLAPAIVPMLVGLLLGLQSGLGSRAEVAAARFEDRPAYAYTAAVLGGRAPAPPVGQLAPAGPDVAQVVSGLVSSAGARGIALVWLFRTRLSEPLRRRTWRIISVGVKLLHAVHGGHVGDYATWLTVGLTGLDAAFAYAILGK